jgi:acyl-CoA hydrolase
MSECGYGLKTLEMSILMTPDKANFTGHVHGGDLLKYLDQAAYACATRYCGEYVVTLSCDKVLFKHPIYVGNLVTFLANVNYTGNTSLEIGIKVISEDIKNHTVTHTNSCYFTMVAIDKNGNPTKVPQLDLQTDEDVRRFKDGEKRKQLRLSNKL